MGPRARREPRARHALSSLGGCRATVPWPFDAGDSTGAAIDRVVWPPRPPSAQALGPLACRRAKARVFSALAISGGPCEGLRAAVCSPYQGAERHACRWEGSCPGRCRVPPAARPRRVPQAMAHEISPVGHRAGSSPRSARQRNGACYTSLGLPAPSVSRKQRRRLEVRADLRGTTLQRRHCLGSARRAPREGGWQPGRRGVNRRSARWRRDAAEVEIPRS